MVGAPTFWALGYTGQGRRLLVIDTGIEGTHPALHTNYLGRFRPAAQVWHNPTGDSIPWDCSGHGTHVAGIALGLDRQAHDTIGLAFQATWMAAPAIKGGAPTCAGTPGPSPLATFQWALDPDGDPTTADFPDVINNSWGGSDTICAAPALYGPTLNALEAAGIAVIFSAGNRGNRPDTAINFPANINTGLVNAFSVGAVNQNFPGPPRAGFSSVGPTRCGGDSSLLIKPEVCAPGMAIRSSVPGGYAPLSGTSMAAPMVAGAALLLKEAFPNATGEQILLALYRSAVDVGDPGEDNFFGMGMINLRAAYDSLVSQGHVPFFPPAERDAALGRLRRPEGACDPIVTPTVQLYNHGRGPLQTVDIAYEILGQVDTLSWSGLLQPGDSVAVAFPPLDLPEGPQWIRVRIVTENGQLPYYTLDDRDSLQIQVVRAPALTTDPGPFTICTGGDAVLQAALSQADSSVRIFWWDAPEGGTLRAEGATVLLPAPTSDTTLYAGLYKSQSLGMPDNSLGGGTYVQGTSPYLTFDADYPMLLRKVTVYPLLAGPRIFEVRNDQGQVVASRIVDLPAAPTRVTLDLEVPMGKAYQLGLNDNGLGALYFNLSGEAFPYVSTEGFFRITGSGGGAQAGKYYFFYDWEVAYAAGCERQAVRLRPGTGTIEADFSVDRRLIDMSNDPVARFTNLSNGASSYHWNFGNGATSSNPNPLHTYVQAGNYTVSLLAEGSAGCADADTLQLTVTGTYPFGVSIAQPNASGAWRLYPNPSEGEIFLERDRAGSGPVQVRLYDLQGRLLATKTARGKRLGWPLPALPAGWYHLRVEADGQVQQLRLLRE
ncbi:MAG: T9SS C-terminal target domain-containing protein [Bacteroidetes bacterium]|nr:MAG: T9SS C-terminal target domain-containing protein [Bacteroidota bacterium]